MNRYAEMRKRQQEEVNALPIGFAFGNRQFEEMMRGWGLDPEKDLDKIYRLGSTGGYYKKSDAQLIRDTFSRHEAEREAAIAEDKTGEGFIYEMFLCELNNHEYGYTMDTEETLDTLGYTADEVLADPRLKRGIEKAVTEICRRGLCGAGICTMYRAAENGFSSHRWPSAITRRNKYVRDYSEDRHGAVGKEYGKVRTICILQIPDWAAACQRIWCLLRPG